MMRSLSVAALLVGLLAGLVGAAPLPASVNYGKLAQRGTCKSDSRRLWIVSDCATIACTAGGGTRSCQTFCDGTRWQVGACDDGPNCTAGLGVHSCTVHVTAAELHDTEPIILVPAAGANTTIVPHAFTYEARGGTTAYCYGKAYPTLGTDEETALTLSSVASGVNPYLNLGGATAGVTRVHTHLVLSLDEARAVVENLPLALTGMNEDAGPIVTATVGTGGSGYVIGDTGTVTTDDTSDATYVVDTVSTGAVATFHLTSAGHCYEVATGVATATGGAQAGSGTGFTVNIAAVGTQGDGDAFLTVEYTVMPLHATTTTTSTSTTSTTTTTTTTTSTSTTTTTTTSTTTTTL